MKRRSLRICLIGGMLATIAATSLRTPGLWHAHDGGDAAHQHGSGEAAYSDERDHALHYHREHGHAHGGDQHAHHGHTHAHGGHRHTHDGDVVPHRPRKSDNGANRTPSDHDIGTQPSTWHVHFSLFGFEMTFSAPAPQGNSESLHAGTPNVAGKSRNRSVPVILANSLANVAFSEDPGLHVTRFLSLESGPMPKETGFPDANASQPLCAAPFLKAGRDPARPPLPPPRG